MSKTGWILLGLGALLLMQRRPGVSANVNLSTGLQPIGFRSPDPVPSGFVAQGGGFTDVVTAMLQAARNVFNPNAGFDTYKGTSASAPLAGMGATLNNQAGQYSYVGAPGVPGTWTPNVQLNAPVTMADPRLLYGAVGVPGMFGGVQYLPLANA